MLQEVTKSAKGCGKYEPPNFDADVIGLLAFLKMIL
jgi:hypothetical protein